MMEEIIRKLNGSKQTVTVEIDPADIPKVKNAGDFCKLVGKKAIAELKEPKIIGVDISKGKDKTVVHKYDNDKDRGQGRNSDR